MLGTGKPAILRENMISIKARAAGAFLAVILLSGCSSQSAVSGVSVADLGGSGGVEYTSQSAQTSAEAQTEQTEQSSQTVSEPEYSAPESVPEQTASTEEASSAPEDTVPEPQPTSEPEQPTTASSAVTTTTKATSATKQTPASSEQTTTTTLATEPVIPANSYGTNGYSALNYGEVKGVWISYIELAQLLQGQPRDSFRKNISAVFDNCAALGINTVYVHVRSHSDAYYRSDLFPWSKYVTGTLGADPGFDPLEIMLDEAHSRGLSFQAWINPLRACGEGQLSSYGSYPVYTFATADGMAGKYAVSVNGTYYLNPAYEQVTQLIADGASEILTKYNVDGLHIDDYFYPTTDASFDSSAFAASGADSLSDFRFANCDRMVSGLYSAVKKANPTAVFSVSVQGRIDNNYTQLYADVKKWCTTSGYLDVIIPQIYYGFENSTAPYQATLDEWEELARNGGIPLVTGLSVSKAGAEDTWAGSGKNEWINNTDILSRQLAAAKKCSSYGGFALYSYRSIFSPDAAVSAAVEKEISALKELI